MTKEEFRAWREKFGLSQGDVAGRFNLSRNTIQNWEAGTTALPSTLEGACAVWEDRLKKEMAEIGPLTLFYADGPMFIDPYRPRGYRTASLKQEPYPTNAAALARVQYLWSRDDFHGPFIIEKSGVPLWNQVELMRVVSGDDKGAPTLANTIRKVSTYARTNSHVHARDGARTSTEEERADAKRLTENIADELDVLAAAEHGAVGYGEFEKLLSRLHALGFYPPNKLVSDVAHAAHGIELAAAA
jgi:transcriptional regulator with XRE-family HTH domain